MCFFLPIQGHLVSGPSWFFSIVRDWSWGMDFMRTHFFIYDIISYYMIRYDMIYIVLIMVVIDYHYCYHCYHYSTLNYLTVNIVLYAHINYYTL